MRAILTIGLPILLAGMPIGDARAAADVERRVIVLGIDGLDPRLLQRFMDEGRLPNFRKLATDGDLSPLGTTMPPLSPIAWSTFITGMDPGGHGIYDFIHRDPATYKPHFSMVRSIGTSRNFPVGKGNCYPGSDSSDKSCRMIMPMGSGSVENLRKGRSFWSMLADAGVPTTIFRMPVNYPPEDTSDRALSGMGTPDIQGTPGTFSFYTDRYVPNAKSIAGGKVFPVRVEQNHVEAYLVGPPNPFRDYVKKARNLRSGAKDKDVEYENPEMRIDFDVWLDPELPVAKIVVEDQQLVLAQGEWSEWVPVEFKPALVQPSVNATARFYLKQVRPEFELYVSPLQISPEAPYLPISEPGDWATELFGELGYFYTQNLPEDTKALDEGILDSHEFWHQAQIVYKERRKALDYLLDRFETGFLFVYFSSIDQTAHMLWRYMDPDHPTFEEDEMLMNGIRDVYQEMDEALGRTMKAVAEDTTLIVMSDHGFSPFYWGVNLNTWLLDKGYVTLRDPSKQGRLPLFLNVDWSKTEAYAVGINGLYVNLAGREKHGVVAAADYDALLDRLERDLLELVDPRNDQKAVTLVVRPRRDYHGEYADDGPDIIVGYNWGYRSSWKSPLGEFPKEVFIDNEKNWSGDHSIDNRLVPGVLMSNRPITMDAPALHDLTVAILDEYGVEKAEGMIGQDCLGGE